MKGGLLSAWLTAVAIVTYRAVKQGGNLPVPRMPLPSTYVSTMLVYGGLGLFPDSANAFTTVFGWGLVVAMLMNLWGPNGQVAGVGTAGTPAQQAAATTASSGLAFGTPPTTPTQLGAGVAKVSSGLGLIARRK